MSTPLNWFAPRSSLTAGAQGSTLALFEALTRHVDLTVWTDAAVPIECGQAVQTWDGSWARLNVGLATVYDIGADRTALKWIGDVARRHPGILIVEDAAILAVDRICPRARGAIVQSDAGLAYLTALGRYPVAQVEPLSFTASAERHSEYASELLASVEKMMQGCSSLLQPMTTTLADVVGRSGFSESSATGLAQRAAAELCRWVAGRSDR